MLEKYFLKKGYYIFNIKPNLIRDLKNILLKEIKKNTKNNKNFQLEYFHKRFKKKKINNLRLYLYKKINSNKKFKNLVYEIGKEILNELVGNELAMSSINLSIQYPKDSNSLLEMHTDFFSGESLFQVNLWIPFVDVNKTQSMFIINPSDSICILKKIKNDQRITFLEIQKKYKSKAEWLDLKFGQGLVFSPNCLHGNVTNKENKTRWSLNIRYKNIYSPYNSYFNNEKKIGNFYKVFSPKIITKFNLKYKFDEFQK